MRPLFSGNGQASPPLFFGGAGGAGFPFAPRPRGAERQEAMARTAVTVASPGMGPTSPAKGDHPADDAGRRAFRRSTAAFFGPRAALHWTGAPDRISEHLAAGS